MIYLDDLSDLDFCRLTINKINDRKLTINDCRLPTNNY